LAPPCRVFLSVGFEPFHGIPYIARSKHIGSELDLHIEASIGPLEFDILVGFDMDSDQVQVGHLQQAAGGIEVLEEEASVGSFDPRQLSPVYDVRWKVGHSFGSW